MIRISKEQDIFFISPSLIFRINTLPDWSSGGVLIYYLEEWSAEPAAGNCPLQSEKKYSILFVLSYRPSACDKAALVGESAVPCNLQSATAGMNSRPRSDPYCLTYISGDEESVPRNGIPWTMSGGEPSSIKRIFSCAAGSPFPSWLYR